jgi:signal transduction histidine kinase/CheY-like chemotaxis protein
MALVVAAIGVVGYASLHSARASVGDLVEQLMAETSRRVDDRIDHVLDDIERISRGNAERLRTGWLDPADTEQVLDRFTEQLAQFEYADSAAVASEDRDFHALERLGGSYVWRSFDRSSGVYASHRLDASGRLGDVLSVLPGYDPHNDPPGDPWYAMARSRQDGFWFFASSVAKGVDQPELMAIHFTPYHDERGRLRGVAAASTFVSRLASFLETLLPGSAGQVFLVDGAGRLVASSSGELPFSVAEHGASYPEVQARTTDRLDAARSADPLTAAAMNAIRQRLGGAEKVGRAEVFPFALQGERHYVRVAHVLRQSLDWRTVVVVPERAFLAGVERNARFSLGVAIVALLAAVGLGAANTRWILRPIERLRDAAGALARGAWTEPLASDRIDALGDLARAFDHMAARLQASFETLDRRVQERTAELAAAKEQAEAANVAKSAFLASVSHELRSPLNVILGYAQMLRDDPAVSAKHRSAVAAVKRSGDHLLALINDVLDLARVESGRLELAAEPLHLPTFLDDLAVATAPLAKAKGLEFSVRAAPLTAPNVLADGTRLRQVLLNLLGNALKFTERGGVTLRLDQVAADLPGRVLVRFEVDDTGPGIDPAALDRIFQPFEQAGSREQRAQGVGLGLAISQRIVKRMGGTIEVQSRAGEGSTFRVAVELPTSHEEFTASPPVAGRVVAYRRGTADSGAPIRVLVADDLPDNRRLIADFLQPLGFDVAEAADGEEAVSQARRVKPHLILMDNVMPRLPGVDAIRQIRSDAGLERAAIISMSASAYAGDRAQSFQAGADAFLPKPVQFEALLEETGRLLELTWLREPVAREAAHSGVPLVPPPAPQLRSLEALLRIGNITRIRQQADALAALGAEFVPFASRLRELAERYDETAIAALLAEATDEGRNGGA